MKPTWKLEKLKALDDEVRELHPVLRQLFSKLPEIVAVEYRQGPNEMGADFVLTRNDPALLEHDYVGVIVKATQIKQDHEDLRRQIRECQFPRTIEGGKKTVHLSEVWVVTNKNITSNAQHAISHEYQSSKFRFLDCDKLLALIDRNYPEFWQHQNALLSGYVAEQRKRIESHAALHSLQSAQVGHVAIDRQIQPAPEGASRKFTGGSAKQVTLLEELRKKRFLYIEGQMGAGKSELLRTTALELCDEEVMESTRIVPCFITYRELVEQGTDLAHEVASIRQTLGDDSLTVAFFVDGLDETSQDLSQRVDRACELAKSLMDVERSKLVIASRDVQDEQVIERIAKSFDKYNICPLSYSAIVSFVEKMCKDEAITDRLRSDLQKSSLLKALPRTPLSAILLGKLIAEKVKELPSTLPELYSKYCELVLGRWDMQKGAGSEKEYETIARITSHIAAYMLENDLEVLGLSELRDMFDDYLKSRKTGQNIDSLLRLFLAKGEIVAFDPEEQLVAFRHQSFKDFFSAVQLFQQKGKEAPLENPFNGRSNAKEYFYLGLIKDAPERLALLRGLKVEHDLDRVVKATSMGSFLMAAYQTPYIEIKRSVFESFRDVAVLYDAITLRGKESWLTKLSELQLLALLTALFKRTYSYEFFVEALRDAKLDFDLDDELNVETKVVGLFLLDAVLADLKDNQAFVRLIDKYEASMPWAIRRGIDFASKAAKFANEATKSMEKRVGKAVKQNPKLNPYLVELESKPIEFRRAQKKRPDPKR